MTKKFKAEGEVWNHVASGAKSSGAVIVMGARVGVALTDIANGATGSVAVRGVFALSKKSGDTFAQGAACYWDAANSYVTSTSSGNTLAGSAAAAAASADTTMDVALNF